MDHGLRSVPDLCTFHPTYPLQVSAAEREQKKSWHKNECTKKKNTCQSTPFRAPPNWEYMSLTPALDLMNTLVLDTQNSPCTSVQTP